MGFPALHGWLRRGGGAVFRREVAARGVFEAVSIRHAVEEGEERGDEGGLGDLFVGPAGFAGRVGVGVPELPGALGEDLDVDEQRLVLRADAGVIQLALGDGVQQLVRSALRPQEACVAAQSVLALVER